MRARAIFLALRQSLARGRALAACGRGEKPPAPRPRSLVAAAASLREVLEADRAGLPGGAPRHEGPLFVRGLVDARAPDPGGRGVRRVPLRRASRRAARPQRRSIAATITPFLGNRLALVVRHGLPDPPNSPAELVCADRLDRARGARGPGRPLRARLPPEGRALRRSSSRGSSTPSNVRAALAPRRIAGPPTTRSSTRPTRGPPRRRSRLDRDGPTDSRDPLRRRPRSPARLRDGRRLRPVPREPGLPRRRREPTGSSAPAHEHGRRAGDDAPLAPRRARGGPRGGRSRDRARLGARAGALPRQGARPDARLAPDGAAAGRDRARPAPALVSRRAPLGRFLEAVVRRADPADVVGGRDRGRGDGVPVPRARRQGGVRIRAASGSSSVAASLGATPCQVFRRVTLPLAARGILHGATFAFARALGEFGATTIVAGNIPGQDRDARARDLRAHRVVPGAARRSLLSCLLRSSSRSRSRAPPRSSLRPRRRPR